MDFPKFMCNEKNLIPASQKQVYVNSANLS